MKTLIVGLLLFGTFFSAPAFPATPEEEKRIATALALAKTPEEKGLAIGLEIDRRLDGMPDTTVEQRLIITNERGEKTVREFRLKILEAPGEGDKFLTVFDKPDDIQGISQLFITHKDREDDLWLYIPALKRVKRISAQARLGSFMGSEFSNEDLIKQEAEKFRWRWIKDEVFNGEMCYVVERYPTEISAYSKMTFWVDKSEFRIQKVEFFDKKNAHVKTLSFSGFKLHLDDFWIQSEMTIVNHHTGKSSTATFDNWKFGQGLNDSDFDLSALQRNR